MAWYLMIKCLFYCNSFQPPAHSFLYCLPPFYVEHDVCVTAVLKDTGGVWVRVQDGQSSSLHTHSPVITAALQILHICLALHRLALLLPSPHHLCLPPTSPLPHQDHPNISPRCFLKLPWVTGPHAQIMLACRGGAGQRGRE